MLPQTPLRKASAMSEPMPAPEDRASNPDSSALGRKALGRKIDVYAEVSQIPDKSYFKRAMDVLVPLLPVGITAATFLISYHFQVVQQTSQAASAEDTEWRKALEPIGKKDSGAAALGAFEMESFFTKNGHHFAQARAIDASLLPRIDDKFTFDVLFFDLIPETTQDSLNQIVTIDSLITTQLRELYSAAIGNHQNEHLPKDMSFRNFIEHPAAFFDESTQSTDLNDVLTKTWELDSVTDGLRALWLGDYADHHLTPDKQSLGDTVFLNGDFTGVDFRHTASMGDVQFYGDCKVDSSKLPVNVKPDCGK